MAMMSARRVFIDTNVLIRATIDTAPLHQEAREMLDALWEARVELVTSQQVLREYMANTTRPQTYSPPLPTHEVLSQVEDFRKNFTVCVDTPAVLVKLIELVSKVPVGGKQIHDANIVATMLVFNVDELLTNNFADFERYRAFIRVIPLVEKDA